LDRIARPSPGAEHVLVRVRATSVNTPDWATVAGVPYALRLKSGLRRPKHAIRGSDIAGTVEAVGPRVTDLQPGDEVLGSLWGTAIGPHAGAFAQYTVAPASQLVKKPAGISFEAAAASVMTGLTALIAMRDAGRVHPGSGSSSTARQVASGRWRSKSPSRWEPR
jgi:NADPH:quinone reductase-like Zn-dependent oxidoreductase